MIGPMTNAVIISPFFNSSFCAFFGGNSNNKLAERVDRRRDEIWLPKMHWAMGGEDGGWPIGGRRRMARRYSGRGSSWPIG